MSKILQKVIRYMVKNSTDGVFEGSPREAMERFGSSCGTYYDSLKKLGFVQRGKGKNALWTIPQSILNDFSGR